MDPQSSKINRDISGLPRDFHPRIPHLPLSSGKLETSIAPIFPSPTTTTPLLWSNKALQAWRHLEHRGRADFSSAGPTTVKKTKVVFLGEQSVGKTSLITKWRGLNCLAWKELKRL